MEELKKAGKTSANLRCDFSTSSSHSFGTLERQARLCPTDADRREGAAEHDRESGLASPVLTARLSLEEPIGADYRQPLGGGRLSHPGLEALLERPTFWQIQ